MRMESTWVDDTATAERAGAMMARFGGDRELTGQLVALFVNECPRMLNRVRECVAGGRADELHRAAHELKGSVANFTDGGPVHAAQALEQMGRDRVMAGAPAMLARLEGELADLLRVMRQFL